MKAMAVLLAAGMLLSGCRQPPKDIGAAETSWKPKFLPPDAVAVGELPPLALRYEFISPTPLGNLRIADGGTVRSGGKFKIRIQPNSDCYLYVLLYDSLGKTEILFPNAETRMSNAARGGVTYSIPESDNWYWFDNNPGRETFYLVASYTPLTDLDVILERLRKADGVATDSPARSARKEIQEIATGHATVVKRIILDHVASRR